jgi:uncharacterized protein (TIGR03032 family)
MSESQTSPGEIPSDASEIRITSSPCPELAAILAGSRSSLLVSTYQAGRVVVLQESAGGLLATYHRFERPMGIAVSRDRIAIGTNNQLWFLVHEPGPTVATHGGIPFDSSYLARTSHVTGEIHGHEIEWSGRDLWVVNTLFSCLCTLGTPHSFVPRWKPGFISRLAAEDRCHLNGLCLDAGRPRFVTALGETDTPRGWRPERVRGGCLIDVPTGEVLLRGLCMPHSPRIHDGRLWLLDSGRGRIVIADLSRGEVQTVAHVPGYARGLAFHGPYAFVGLSRLRPGSSTDGLPIAASTTLLRCGVAVIDTTKGHLAALLEFQSGIEETFDVKVNPYAPRPFFSGPSAREDGTPPIWTIPPTSFHGARPSGNSP